MNSLARKFEKYILESYELETLDNADSIDVSLNTGELEGFIHACYAFIIEDFITFNVLCHDDTTPSSVTAVSRRLRDGSNDVDLVPLSDVVDELLDVFNKLDKR